MGLSDPNRANRRGCKTYPDDAPFAPALHERVEKCDLQEQRNQPVERQH